MRPVTILALTTVLGLSGCARIAESRFNPLNLFQGLGAAPTTADGNPAPLVSAAELAGPVDSRGLVAVIGTIDIAPTSSGIILSATGLAPGQGFYNAQLVPVRAADGVLQFAFRAQAPAQQPAGARPQTITAARVLDAAALRGITQIIVQGAQNSRSVPL